jgi:predicted nucleotide-binding protein
VQESESTPVAYLQELMAKASAVTLGDEAALDAVQRQTRTFIRRTFGEGHVYQHEFDNIVFPSEYFYREDEFKNDWTLNKQRVVNLLEAMLKEIEVFGLSTATADTRVDTEVLKRVFISHGHDARMREDAVAFIKQVGLDPVIMEERPSEGRTVVEKLEHYSNVSFAVILLSPDDLAYAKSKLPAEAKPRARQNVILELGYFLAKLGRKDVLVLHRKTKGFEKPSVIDGVIYVPYEELGDWRSSLVIELQARGHNIDMSELLEIEIAALDIPF